MQSAVIGYAQSHQLLIALDYMEHAALTDRESAQMELLMNLWDRAMLTVAQGPHQGNDLQAKLSMGQSPDPFFFGMIAHVIAFTFSLATTAYHYRSSAEAFQGGDRPLIVIGHPHSLSTTATGLLLRPQDLFLLLKLGQSNQGGIIFASSKAKRIPTSTKYW